ncbi:MAG: hypothetical protein AAF492_22600, partial [Verrucomicrobiota bacterium]
PDTDDDGIPDVDDPDDDGDGVSDADEAIANTDPLDSNDWMRIEIRLPTPGNVSELHFTTSIGRLYRIQQSTNPVTGPWLDGRTPIVGSGFATNVVTTNGVESQFFRLMVERP